MIVRVVDDSVYLPSYLMWRTIQYRESYMWILCHFLTNLFQTLRISCNFQSNRLIAKCIFPKMILYTFFILHHTIILYHYFKYNFFCLLAHKQRHMFCPGGQALVLNKPKKKWTARTNTLESIAINTQITQGKAKPAGTRALREVPKFKVFKKQSFCLSV